jgi:hypothetical protein
MKLSKVSQHHITCFDQYGHHQVFKLLLMESAVLLFSVYGPIYVFVYPIVINHSSCCVKKSVGMKTEQ